MTTTKIIDHIGHQLHRSLSCQIASNHCILKIITCLCAPQADVAWRVEQAVRVVNNWRPFTQVVIMSANRQTGLQCPWASPVAPGVPGPFGAKSPSPRAKIKILWTRGLLGLLCKRGGLFIIIKRPRVYMGTGGILGTRGCT